MKIHLLFEQSGTFKNEFKKLGYNALSYDIENRFNETDVVIDLFNEIEEFETRKTIFDDIKVDDLVFAFFPCTYFSQQNNLIFNKSCYNFRNWSNEKINAYINKRKHIRDHYFKLFKTMIEILSQKGVSLIIENPAGDNYLRKAFKEPDLLINNRSLLGDNHIKPTMFYSFNFNLKKNNIDLRLNNEVVLKHNNISGILRSQMHPDFAHNFIRKYIL